MQQTNDDIRFMRLALEEAQLAYEADEVPVGCIVACRGQIVGRGHNLTETLSDVTAHAEMQAITAAMQTLGSKYLTDCTLYVTVEPCAMCAGAIYWANIGRVVYGITEKKLLRLTGNHAQNPTFDLPCRQVFACGQKAIQVIGPFPELEEETAAVHAGFWD